MNRREALKKFGLGAGFLVVGPTTFSLLQSCKNEPSYDWQPVFLSAANGLALKKILEIILPRTDTPGASDLNIPQFIDSYMEEVAELEKQKIFSQNADYFAKAFENETGKSFEEAKPEHFEQVVKKYLKQTPAEETSRVKRNTEEQDPMDKDPEEIMTYDEGALAYLKEVRDMGIWAYKTSEEIGENVMWYDPVPGVYIPCGDVDELSNGKAMSL